MKAGVLVLLAIVCALSGCASTREDAREQAIEDCMKGAGLREGESLNSGFQQRAARAHCEKAVDANAGK